MLKISAFFKHFVKPEFNHIAGKFYKNLIIVLLIFLLSLLTIGLGKGVTQYLGEKMKDPFIRFVDLQIPSGAVEFNWESLNKDTLQKRFKYGDIEPIYFRYMNFQTKNKKVVSGKARKINTKSKFYNYIKDNKEVFVTNPVRNNFSNDNYGVIVTKSFLKDLGYNRTKIPFIKYKIEVKNKRHIIPLPVMGVVNKLPNYTDLLISKELDDAYRRKFQAFDVTSYEHQSYLRFYLDTGKKVIDKLKNKGYKKVSNNIPFGKGALFEKNGIEQIQAELEELRKIAGNNYVRFYDLDRGFDEQLDDKLQEDLVTIPFKRSGLKKVYVFNEYLMQNFKGDLRLNMSTIKSKKNFQIFNNISLILSFVLIVFSILVVILFVTNIILSHIEKNKKNLGTLKAFGLPNRSIVFIYSLIAGSMIVIAFIFAFIISHLVGDPIINNIISILGLNVDVGSIQFQLYAFWLVFLFFIIIPVIVLYIRLKATLKKQTPGDLVFERV